MMKKETFPSLHIEGGLLDVELLESLSGEDFPGQRFSDFGFSTAEQFRTEIANVFTSARILWERFQTDLYEPAPSGGQSAAAQFTTLFLRLLGHAPCAANGGDEAFPVSHRLGADPATAPLHIVGGGAPLGRVAPGARPRLSPHGLLQEHLNAGDRLWGLVSNGGALRLLRASSFIRRQPYVEFDLRKLFAEGLLEDFTLLFRLLHGTRFPGPKVAPEDCWLERYHQRAVEQGGRVRDKLRDGVERCLVTLGDGFLRHPANKALRADLASGAATAATFYRDLLGLVYRLLFLLVSERRGVLNGSPVYVAHYGVGRLRRYISARDEYTAHEDIWLTLQAVFRILRSDAATDLGLPPLNGGLFEPSPFDACVISNRRFLEAMQALFLYWDETASELRWVNYAALDVEELGSVYESLLDFRPEIQWDEYGNLTFRLTPAGHERKSTGSYYTPPELVSELLRTTLEPVLEARRREARNAAEMEQAILTLTVCDPACGSGHFLLAAARRLGRALAQARTGETEPSPAALRAATRDVISHCLYGVDVNPLAVELCRVALWLEGHTEHKPLAFLDHRIRCGDALVGVMNLEILKQGIPDAAYEGAAAAAARRRNKKEKAAAAAGQMTLPFRTDSQSLAAEFAEVGARPDATLTDVREKQAAYEAARATAPRPALQSACDLWTGAFFQSFESSASDGSETCGWTTQDVFDALNGAAMPLNVTAEAQATAFRRRFFHWPVEFPEVFARGGFDVVLGNPPWERIKLQEKEFFAGRDERIVRARHKAARARLIAAAEAENPALFASYRQARSDAEATSRFVRRGGRFPLTGCGDVNTYALFAETALSLLRPGGRAGIVVPTGIASDDTTKVFFQHLVRDRALASLYDFENRAGMFPAVDGRFRFCLLTMTRGEAVAAPDFVFLSRSVKDVQDEEKHCSLTAEDFELLNPNTLNCPMFRTRKDAVLTKAIYRRAPVLWREAGSSRTECNPWGLTFKTLFHMANDSGLFHEASALKNRGGELRGNIFTVGKARFLPLYEAKMVHQFDHRWATYDAGGKVRDLTEEEKSDPAVVVQPRYWIGEAEVRAALARCPSAVGRMPAQTGGTETGSAVAAPERPAPEWLLGWRDITNATNERTLIASALPPTAIGHKLLLCFPDTPPRLRLTLLAALNGFVTDYAARQKLAGTHITFFIFRQLPVPSPELFGRCFPGVQFFAERALELVYTANDLKPLAQECGFTGPPFKWNAERRFLLRCELDAALFHLYLPADRSGAWLPARVADGRPVDEKVAELDELKRHFPTPRAAVAYILDQFPLVKSREEKQWGHYRTREKILDFYDNMQNAPATGRPYVSPLFPPSEACA